jgi:hypothetical protein
MILAKRAFVLASPICSNGGAVLAGQLERRRRWRTVEQGDEAPLPA